MTKLSRLENYLKSGSTATPLQINKMFGLVNHTSAIHALRSKGLCVYANSTTLSTGQPTVRYSIGKPTKKMIRIAHALGVFA